MAKRITKSAFIRELGPIPAKEAVEKGKAAGLKFSVTYVYNVRRGTMPKTAARRRAGRPPKSGTGLHATIDRLVARVVDRIVKAVQSAIADATR